MPDRWRMKWIKAPLVGHEILKKIEFAEVLWMWSTSPNFTYCKTLFSLHFNFSFSQHSTSIYQAFGWQTENFWRYL